MGATTTMVEMAEVVVENCEIETQGENCQIETQGRPLVQADQMDQLEESHHQEAKKGEYHHQEQRVVGENRMSSSS